jgi:hypothetical protein
MPPHRQAVPFYAIDSTTLIMKFFNKLFGGQEKESLATPPELSSIGKRILRQRGFGLTQSSDNNMWKYYEWTNSEFRFSLTYDRGYYDCDVCVLNGGPDFRMRLIPLLKFLKNDRTYYNKQLKEVNLWRTLAPDGYVMLLDENYDLITSFFQNYNPDNFEKFKNFDFDYDGI